MSKRITMSLILCVSLLSLSLFSTSSLADNADNKIYEASEEGLEYLLFNEIPTVITSTITQKNILNAPSTIVVIDEKEIRESGVKNLNELIDRANGILTHSIYNTKKYSVLRGVEMITNPDKIKVLINGHAIAEPFWGDYSDFLTIGLKSIKQVEIIRGPGSALYGTNAFAGVINIITKKPSEIDGTIADIKYGSYNTQQAEVVFGKAFDKLEVGIDANYAKTDGAGGILEWDSLRGTPLTITPTKLHTGDERWNVDLNLIYENFSLKAFHIQSDSEYPASPFYIASEKGLKSSTKLDSVEAKYSFILSDTLQIKLRAYYDNYSFKTFGQMFPRGFFIPFDIDMDGSGIEYWPDGGHINYGVDSTVTGPEAILEWKITDNNLLLLGVFYENTKWNDSYFESDFHPIYSFHLPAITKFTDTQSFISNDNHSVYGTFIQDEFNIVKDVYMILGCRYDKYSDVGSTVNPRCGLVMHYNEEKGTVKIIYGSAFKAPTLAQSRTQNNTSIVGNLNLDPETINTAEISLNYIFAKKLQTTFCIYQSKLKDLINIGSERDLSLPGAPVIYANRGKQKILGTEFEMKYVFSDKNFLTAGYFYTKPEDEITGNTIKTIPQNLASLGLNLHFLENINWNILLDYTGDCERYPGDPRDAVDATSLLYTTLRIEDIKGWDIYFSINNITDENLFMPIPPGMTSDLVEAGRNYVVGTSYKF